MKFEWPLALRNLCRRPVRTAALAAVSALLAFSVFGGSLAVSGLRRGLASYASRLGADVVVVPNQARSHGTLESILLQGIPGYFYTDAACLDKIRAMEGVQAAAPQFFLASASAGCCSVPVQIIGFDPEADFSIQPWIQTRYTGTIGPGDIVVGSGIAVPGSRELTFYNTPCRVAAQLDETGTGLDTAIYASMDTVKAMMRAAQDMGFHAFDGVDPDRSVSSVLVRVRDGYPIQAVTDDINLHVRRVQASQARTMISGIAEGLAGVSQVIGLLTALVWALSLGALAAAYGMISHERAREFAVLRVLGASERMLSRLALAESALVGMGGAAAGAALAALLFLPFSGLMRARLDLPYLLPGPGWTAALFLGAALLSAAAGTMASVLSARRVSRQEAGLLLRESA